VAIAECLSALRTQYPVPTLSPSASPLATDHQRIRVVSITLDKPFPKTSFPFSCPASPRRKHRDSPHQTPPAPRSRQAKPERPIFQVAQTLFQNIFPSTHNHSYFPEPNRSRLIETDDKPMPPPPCGSRKKGVRAFFKPIVFSRPDSISRDNTTGKMLLVCLLCPLPPNSKSPRKSSIRRGRNCAPHIPRCDFSLFQNPRTALFQNPSTFPAPMMFQHTTQKPEPSPATFGVHRLVLCRLYSLLSIPSPLIRQRTLNGHSNPKNLQFLGTFTK